MDALKMKETYKRSVEDEFIRSWVIMHWMNSGGNNKNCGDINNIFFNIYI